MIQTTSNYTLIYNKCHTNLIDKATIHKVELSGNENKAICHCYEHLNAIHSVYLLRNFTNFIVRTTQIN